MNECFRALRELGYDEFREYIKVKRLPFKENSRLLMVKNVIIDKETEEIVCNIDEPPKVTNLDTTPIFFYWWQNQWHVAAPGCLCMDENPDFYKCKSLKFLVWDAASGCINWRTMDPKYTYVYMFDWKKGCLKCVDRHLTSCDHSNH